MFFYNVSVGGGVVGFSVIENCFKNLKEKLLKSKQTREKFKGKKINFAIIDRQPENIPGGVAYGLACSQYGYFNNPIRLSPKEFVSWIKEKKNKYLILKYIKEKEGYTGRLWLNNYKNKLLNNQIKEIYLPRASLNFWLENKLINLLDEMKKFSEKIGIIFQIHFYEGEILKILNFKNGIKEFISKKNGLIELKIKRINNKLKKISFERINNNLVSIYSLTQTISLGIQPPKQLASEKVVNEKYYIWDFYSEGSTANLLKLLNEKIKKKKDKLIIIFIGNKAGLLEPLAELLKKINKIKNKCKIYAISNDFKTLQKAKLTKNKTPYKLQFLKKKNKIKTAEEIYNNILDEFDFAEKSGYLKYDAWTKILMSGFLNYRILKLNKNEKYKYDKTFHTKIRSLTRFTYPETVDIKEQMEKNDILEMVYEEAKKVNRNNKSLYVETNKKKYLGDIVINVAGPMSVTKIKKEVPLIYSLKKNGGKFLENGFIVNKHFELKGSTNTFLPGILAQGFNPARKTIIKAILENSKKSSLNISKIILNNEKKKLINNKIFMKSFLKNNCKKFKVLSFGGVRIPLSLLKEFKKKSNKKIIYNKSALICPTLCPFYITIDGKAGAGKSTLANELSKILNIISFDSGYIFKATIKKLLKKKISINQKNRLKIIKTLNSVSIEDLMNNELNKPIFSKLSPDLANMNYIREFFNKKIMDISKNFFSLIVTGRDCGEKTYDKNKNKNSIFLNVSDHIAADRKKKERLSIETKIRNLKDKKNIKIPKLTKLINTNNKSAKEVLNDALKIF